MRGQQVRGQVEAAERARSAGVRADACFDCTLGPGTEPVMGRQAKAEPSRTAVR